MLVSLNVLKLELQYERTPPQILFVYITFYNYYVTMCREPLISRVVQNSWNWNFRDLVLILPPKVFYKKGILKNFAIFTGKHLCQSLFLSCNIKKRLWHRGLPVNFSRFLRTSFLENTSGWDSFYVTTVAGFMLCNYI